MVNQKLTDIKSLKVTSDEGEKLNFAVEYFDAGYVIVSYASGKRN